MNRQILNEAAMLKIKALEEAAVKLNSSTFPEIIECRQDEMFQISIFLQTCISEGSSGTMILIGPPGTGKSMCMNECLKKIVGSRLPNGGPSDENTQNSTPSKRKNEKPCIKNSDIVSLNGISMQNGLTLLAKLFVLCGCKDSSLKNLSENVRDNGIGHVMKCLQKIRSRSVNHKFITIDEFDHLIPEEKTSNPRIPTSVSANQRRLRSRNNLSSQVECSNDLILKHIFEFIAQKNSKIILLGTANSVHFVRNEVLQSLWLRPDEFKTIQFSSYSVADLQQIVRKRLASINAFLPQGMMEDITISDNDIIDSAALELCTKKINSSQGDCRQTLDACRRMVLEKLGKLREEEASNMQLKQVKTSNLKAECTKNTLRKKCLKPSKNRMSFTEKNRTDDVEELQTCNGVNMTPYISLSDASTCPSSDEVQNEEFNIGSKDRRDNNQFNQFNQFNQNCKNNQFESKIGSTNFQIDMKDAQQILKRQLQSSHQKNYENIRQLPLNQQILLCSISVLKLSSLDTECESTDSKQSSNSNSLETKQIWDKYTSLCHTCHVAPHYSSAESILDGLEGLQNCGVVALQYKSKPRASKKRMSNVASRTGRGTNAIPSSICTVELVSDPRDIINTLKATNGVLDMMMSAEVEVSSE